MIKGVLIFNSSGKPRLSHWYQPIDVPTQQALLQDIYRLVIKRPDKACNFLESNGVLGDDARIIYRHYATLYFIFVVDSSESELGILDLIQVFVECLDRVFVNVCELDLVFRPQDVSKVLSEIISGGLVLETNINDITVASHVKKSSADHR